MADTLDKIKSIVAREFRTDVLKLDRNSSNETVTGWDSATHLILMMSVEEAFGISFDLDEVIELTSIGGIVDAVETKLPARTK